MTTEPQPAAPGEGTSTNPFAGIPASDFVRDGVAFLLLVLSLAMPWDLEKDATGNVAVVLVTLLSILSLALTYLGHAKVFGSALNTVQVGLIRAAANVPYVILVIVYLVIDISKTGDGWYMEGGVGFAAALGLAGAALAGMPRVFETAPSSGTAIQRTVMRAAVLGLAALWAALSFLNIVFLLVDYADLVDNAAAMGAVILNTLILFAAFALLAFGFLRSSEVTRTVAVTAGVIALGIILVDWLTDWELSGVGVESVHRPGFAAIGFLTLGAVASSHVTAALSAPIDRARKWLGSAVTLLAANAAIAIVVVLSVVLTLIADLGLSVGKAVAYILVMLLIAVATAIAWSLARMAYPAQRTLVVAAIAGTIVLGIVAVVLVNSMASIGMLDLAYAFGIPIAVLALLLAPTSLRGPSPVTAAPAAHVDAAPPAPSAPAQPAPPSAAPVADAPPPPPPAADVPEAAPAPADHPRSAEAADPQTSASALYEIATTIPELRPVVAANPACYPDLLEWLGKLGDPEIDKAIASRP